MSFEQAREARRGPPPFLVQLLRAPLALNNAVALAITIPIHRARRGTTLDNEGCSLLSSHYLFGLLAILFAVSIGHSLLAVGRFHKIRRETFGASSCAARKRWRSEGAIALTDEDRATRRSKFADLSRRMPSLWISMMDFVLSLGFLGLWILTTLFAKAEGKVELGVAYASIGSLVAFILNLVIAMNGLKLWVRQHRRRNASEDDLAGNETKAALLS